ncbi:hypothetical protein FRB94_010232 [Tulasnella sp. JGI-2019a]|nr:hypothetical protein FRB93_009312 [Tulasnella sp. JGI-2019a]KAG8993974.1 hypothetical protein FRB94_010232 [Tulasnella sp. JGI-2019a]KAG9025496.1 hypothetical protein FRB95_010103 [Tulasnella sp. JGI-2019a]
MYPLTALASALVLVATVIAQTTSPSADSITFDYPQTVRAGEIHVLSSSVTLGNNAKADRQISYSSIELMGGGNADGGNQVISIISYTPEPTTFIGIAYTFPQNLVAGSYHTRVNITTNSTDTASSPTTNSTFLSPTIAVTAFSSFQCLSPPAYTNVTSVTAPNYRSLFITEPAAGDVLDIPILPAPPANPALYVLAWSFVDGRNLAPTLANGVDSLTMEFVQGHFDGDSNTTTYFSAGSFPVDATTGSTNYPLSTLSLFPGEWRVRANYTNIYEGGPQGQRNNVSALSEPFFIAGVTAKSSCYGVAGKGAQASSAVMQRSTLWTPTVGGLMTMLAAVMTL